MRIALIGPGAIPIPPTGWGAIEILIHDLRIWLERSGHTVAVVNTPDADEMVRQVNGFAPDFVHCHADNLVRHLGRVDCPAKAATSHFGYLDEVWRHGAYVRQSYVPLILQTDVHVFALSPSILARYVADGVTPERLHLMPNGVRCDLFRVSDTPRLAERSVCLARVYRRKRQGFVQKAVADVDFVGNTTLKAAYGCGFDPTGPDYLGEWTKADVYDRLTDYGNLVLLSDGEAHPLVCLEALAAGLGVVVSRAAAANLDPALPFIDVLEESELDDPRHVREIIERNRRNSVGQRPDILAYANTFSFERAVRRYIDTATAIVSAASAAAPPRPTPRRALVVGLARPEQQTAVDAWLARAQTAAPSAILSLHAVPRADRAASDPAWWWRPLLDDEALLADHSAVAVVEAEALENLAVDDLFGPSFFAAATAEAGVSDGAWGGQTPYLRQALRLMLHRLLTELDVGRATTPQGLVAQTFAWASRLGIARTTPAPSETPVKAAKMPVASREVLMGWLAALERGAARSAAMDDLAPSPPRPWLQRRLRDVRMSAKIGFWRLKLLLRRGQQRPTS